MGHAPDRAAVQQPDRAEATVAAGEQLSADDLAVGHAQRVEQAVHRVDVVDQARAVGGGEAREQVARQRHRDRARHLLALHGPARARPGRASTSAARRWRVVAHERPGVGVVDLDRDEAELVRAARQQPQGRLVARVEPLHVADLADPARHGRGPRSAGRCRRRRSRAASRRRRAGRPRTQPGHARNAAHPARPRPRRRAAVASSSSTVATRRHGEGLGDEGARRGRRIADHASAKRSLRRSRLGMCSIWAIMPAPITPVRRTVMVRFSPRGGPEPIERQSMERHRSVKAWLVESCHSRRLLRLGDDGDDNPRRDRGDDRWPELTRRMLAGLAAGRRRSPAADPVHRWRRARRPASP